MSILQEDIRVCDFCECKTIISQPGSLYKKMVHTRSDPFIICISCMEDLYYELDTIFKDKSFRVVDAD